MVHLPDCYHSCYHSAITSQELSLASITSIRIPIISSITPYHSSYHFRYHLAITFAIRSIELAIRSIELAIGPIELAITLAIGLIELLIDVHAQAIRWSNR